MFGSTHSLLGFANSDANMHKVASLDMLRTLCEQRQGDARASDALGTSQSGASPQPTQLFQSSPHQPEAHGSAGARNGT